MAIENGNGNGNKTALKYVLSVVSAIIVGLVAWNFKAVQDAQIELGRQGMRIESMESQITTMTRDSSQFQDQERQINGKLFDTLTDIRVQLGASRDGKK